VLLGTSTLSQGLAIYATSGLTVGTHLITAMYGGDAKFSSLASPSIQETIQDFSVGILPGTSSSVTLVGGGTANYEILLTPTNGSTFPAPVAFAVHGLPPGATATFAPTTVSSGAGTTTTTLTIQVPQKVSSNRYGTALLLTLPPIAIGMLLLGKPWTSRYSSLRANRIASLLLVLTLAGVAIVMSACGGSSQSKPGPGQSGPTDYSVTVGASSGTLTHSTVVTLTLE